MNSFLTFNALFFSGYTALHDACYYGHEEIADELCRRGAKVNCFDKDGKTPLHVSFTLRCVSTWPCLLP